MKKVLILFIFTWMIVMTTFSQLTTWTWDQYKVKFDAPTDFKVDDNNAEVFSAGNGHINLTIYPQTNVSTEIDAMTENLSKWAINTDLSFDMQPEFLEDLNGYWGVYIDGEASNGNPTTVVLLIDPDYPDIGLYIWLQYQIDYFETAVDILASFTPN